MDGNSLLIQMENLSYEDTAEDMMLVAKTCLETRQRLAHTTGRELDISKSSISMTSWKLRGNGETVHNHRHPRKSRNTLREI